MPFNQTGPSSHMQVGRDYNDVAGNQYNSIINVDTSDVLSRLKATLNPSHLPGVDRSTCLRGTRTHIRGKISKLMDRKSSESNIAFLLGAAGTGKSTIATTIADKYRRAKRLGCHLFFLREKSDPMTVIQTIAYNLAASNASIALAIDKSLRSYGDLSSATLDSLFDILLYRPLSSISPQLSSKILIVLDALDECGSSESRKPLLRVLTEKISSLPHNFRFLITSRPEIDIMSFVSSIKSYIIDLDILPDENMKDVCTYINYEFNAMKDNGRLFLPDDWPWEENMRKLAQAANGLFIWASTAVKFIEEMEECGAESLEALVRDRSLNLDGLYETVLKTSLKWGPSTKSTFPDIFSLIFFGKEPLTDLEIDRILNINEGTTRNMLRRLRSLVIFETNQKVRIHHASFHDYLVSVRGRNWSIDIGKQKEMIASKCFERMAGSLRFNICKLESSFLLNEQVSGLQERIKRYIPTHLQYVCCNWAHHLRDVTYTLELSKLLITFAYKKLLFWFEVLSLTGTFDDCAGTALVYAISWLGSNNPELSSFLRDAYRQATVFSEAISNSAPHIYCSLLPLTRDESVVSLHYKKYANPVAHIEYIGNRQRSAVIKIINCGDRNLTGLSFSPDGTRIISLGKTACMWDAASGKLIASLEYTADTTAFSPSGDLVALAFCMNEDGVIAMWSPLEDVIIRELRTDDTSRVCSITYSKSGKYIASGDENGKLLIWDIESGRVYGKPLMGHTGGVISISFSCDDQYLVSGSGSDGATIILWNVLSRTMVYAPLQGHKIRASTVAFSPTAEYILSASYDQTVRIWRTSTGEEIRRLKGCTQATYSADGLRILGFDGRCTFKIWNMSNVDEPPREFNSIYHCDCVAFAPDGTRFAFVTGRKSIEIWDATVPAISTNRAQVQSEIISMAVSPRGKYIAAGDHNGTICVWDTVNGKLISDPWKGHIERVTSVAFSPEQKFVASGSRDKTVRVWKTSSGEIVATLKGHTEWINSVAFSPNGKYVASSSWDSTIRVWSVERRELALMPFLGDSHGSDFRSKLNVTSIAYSPDGVKIVSGSNEGTVRIWNATNGQLLSILQGHSGPIRSVAYSTDGLHVASVSDDETMRRWCVKTGKSFSVMHSTTPSSVSFSPDGTLILSGFYNGTIRIWNSVTHEFPLGTLTTHSDWATFLPDNKHFATSSYDGTIRVWSLDDVDWDLRREDGWVVDKDNKLLMWLPKGPRETLITPRNPVIMNVPYNTRVDFSRYRVGNEWINPSE